MKKIALLIFVNLSFICATSSAVTFSFTGLGNQFAAMDRQAEISGTVDGTQLTLKATSALNFFDAPNQFLYVGPDHGFLALYKNSLTFTMEFDQAVQIRQFTFENVGFDSITDPLSFKLLIGGAEERDITIPDFVTNDQFERLSTVTLANPLAVSANTEVTFQGVVPTIYGTNGVRVSLRNMEVNVVPEPASYALGLGLGSVLFIAVRRRRMKKAHA